MTKFEKNKLNQRTKIHRLLPKLASDAPVKLIYVILYTLGAIWVWYKQENIASSVPEMEYMAPFIELTLQNVFQFYLLAGGIFLTILVLTPIGKRSVQDQLKSIGLVNHAASVPELKRKTRDKQNPRLTILEFTTQGIPMKVWTEKQAAIETALDLTIVKMKYGSGKSRILLYTVPARTDLPEVLNWNDKYLSHESFTLTLGESYIGPVQVNLAKVPHILLGGSTGSGKSILLKLLLMQSLQKGAVVCISDFKGGVDFPTVWHQKCRMCFEEESLLELLSELTDELQRRTTLFRAAGVPNIDAYNAAKGDNLPRHIFACDEVAEVLDKTGLNKNQKEVVLQIESKLSMIARLGRAFGIHLILATQRPDATILPGQIRNNLDCRICGRADNVLSQIILDSTTAAEQIPKDAAGRFLLHDGTIFQSYWFDEEFESCNPHTMP